MAEENIRCRVLVVDDNVRPARTLISYMGTQEFSAKAAHSAEAALSEIQEQDFEVAVIDINMPGIDGFQLCRRILEVKPGTKVLMLSGRDGADDQVKAREAGAEQLLL